MGPSAGRSSRGLPRRWRFRAGALLAFGLLLGCGGGGGDGTGGGGGGVGPLPSVRLAGNVRFSPTLRATVVENEPNDALGDSQYVGDIRLGERVTMVGRVDPASDPLDGFHFRAPMRLRITVSLVHAPGGDLDVLVYDPTALQFVETFQTSAQPETGVLHARGSFDVVVRATSGAASNYELVLVAEAPAAPIAEREPNDAPGQAQFLGDVVPADTVTVRGVGTLGSDAVDAVLVSCPAAVRLDLSLAFPAFQDFDLRVLDATADLLAPTPLAQYQQTTPSPERGTLDVPAGRLLHVEVVAKTAGGTWTLTVTGAAPPVPARVSSVREDASPIAPLSSEAARLRDPAPGPGYGRAVRPAVPGEAVVSLRAGEEERGEAEIGARGGRIVDRSGPRRRVVFDLPPAGDEEAGRRTLSRVRALEGGSATEFAEPNRLLRPLLEPDDPYYPLQWHYEQIRLPEAWDVTTGSASVVVAVIDTGIAHHPDIPSPLSGYDFVSSTSMSGDGDGRDGDPTDPGDRALGSSSSFHGTHVAGTIGAITDNGTGVAGICWSVKLLHVRALGQGGGTTFDIGEAIRYAARLSNASGTLPAVRAHVINMSLGGPGPDATLEAACAAARAAGVLVVAAAGNESSDQFFSPAGYPSVVSVGALDYRKELSWYSNYGNTVDLVAPGGDMGQDANADGQPDGVLSTQRVDSVSPPSDTYRFAQGTSMASPHVAGVAALLFAVDPNLTADRAQTILQDTAEDLGTAGRDYAYGHGLVDAHAAVLRASAAPPPVAPVLRLSPDLLNFGAVETTLDTTITNGGGSMLQVQPPVVVDPAASPWLQAALVTPGDVDQDAAAVRVTVDRTGLAAGVYFARVRVDSDGGSKTFDVVMSVVLAPAPVPDLDIVVRLIDAESGYPVLEQVVNPRTGLSFLFAAVPVGRYRLVASTDVDGDGVDCEPGEYCGAFPILTDPAVLYLVAGSDVSGLSFSVNVVAGL